MMALQYMCKGRHRLEDIRKSSLNGIDYVEIYRRKTASYERCALLVRCLKDTSGIGAGSISIGGGKRITIGPVWAYPASRFAAASPAADVDDTEKGYFSSLPEGDNVIVIRLDKPGDYGTYTLSIADNSFDPVLRSLDFSFLAECAGEFDCRPDTACKADANSQPPINYLAKDYAGFRQLILDRMALLMPQWTERNPADTGMVMVELLAYLGDQLSYRQDAIATEAYMDTARSRISVKRHARLVDYRVHEGCNARAWVQVQVSADNVVIPAGTPLYTRIPGQDTLIVPRAPSPDFSRAEGLEVFETVFGITLFKGHNRMSFYTWGEPGCCLPAGSTIATLEGFFPHLKPGDVLVFEEIRSPDTLMSEDASPARKHAVRLTACAPGNDPLYHKEITEIAWGKDDALPFPLFIKRGGEGVETSIASGNIVLADHGITINEELGLIKSVKSGRALLLNPLTGKIGRGYPRIGRSPLTYTVPYEKWIFSCDRSYTVELDSGKLPISLQRLFAQKGIYFKGTPAITPGRLRWSVVDDKQGFVIVDEGNDLDIYALPGPASQVPQQAPQDARPSITIKEELGTGHVQEWSGTTDILECGPLSREFVVETADDGTPFIRFGDGCSGKLPEAGSKLTATYRVGNGARGNVGREAIAHIVANDTAITAVRNPMPASGSTEPERVEHVRQCAPMAFKTQLRAVTPQDYEAMAMKYPGISKAAATFRWTGSWHTVYVTIDRAGGLDVDDFFKRDVKDHLEQYRMAGHDIEVDGPAFVPLEVSMKVRVKPGFFKETVKKALLDRFGAGTMPDGRPGLFHPDHFTFGQPVYLSSLYMTAQEVEGVAWAQASVFQPMNRPDKSGLAEGRLTMGKLEIARLDNDRDHPENGMILFTMEESQ